MEGLLFFRVRPSDGFRFIRGFMFVPDGNTSHEFLVLDGNTSSIQLLMSSQIRRKSVLLILQFAAETKSA
jgi:hypothetical protein